MSETTDTPFSLQFLETLSYTTPYFLFSKEKILANVEAYKKHFPGAAIHYAMKANSEPEVLAFLAKEDCGFEVASLYELDMLKKIKVSPEKIIYGSAVKPASHIKAFVNYGVDRFAYDSFQELEKIALIAPGARVFARAVVNDAGSVFKFSEKFGTEFANIAPLLHRAKELGLKPYGISFHVGSQASDGMAWSHALQSVSDVMKELQSMDITIDIVNIGGGFPCTYALNSVVPQVSDIAKTVQEAWKKLPYQPGMILEPGRGIIADTGILVATIIGKVQRKESTWLFLDAGCYNALFETMAYQGSTRYQVTSMRTSDGAGETIFALAGPTGDSEDVITREALLPNDIAVGDKLVFYKVGAYSLVNASPFNGFPRPEVYFQ